MTTLSPPRVQGQHTNHALAALRRERAIQLRASGMSFEAIAQNMGYANRGTVHRIVQKAMQEHVAEAVSDRRAVEGARLDALQAGLWEKALEGDVRAAWLVRQIILDRIELFGLADPAPEALEGHPRVRTVVDPKIAEQLAGR